MRLAPLLLLGSVLAAADWPHYLGDGGHGGVSPDTPADLRVLPAWTFQATPPSPGFHPQLRADTLGMQKLLAPAATHDYAAAPVIAGGRIFLPSSSEESVTCLDAATGAVRWVFHAEGAVRFAPAVVDGLALFGADDGRVYALDAATGAERWRRDLAPEPRRIVASGRIASAWPVRTGIAVADGVAHVAAGVFPTMGGVSLHALRAADGTPLWRQALETAAHGYPVIEDSRLVVPNGRASPIEYHLADGKMIPARTDFRREGGGSFLARVGGMLCYGPSEFGILRFRVDRDGTAEKPMMSTAAMRSLPGSMTGIAAWRAVQAGDTAVLLRGDEVLALPAARLREILSASAAGYRRIPNVEKSSVQLNTDRDAEAALGAAATWKAAVTGGRALIVAGSLAVVGGAEAVSAFALADGKPVWQGRVAGTAWELAAADGRIHAATDTGSFSTFGGEPVLRMMRVTAPLVPDPAAPGILARADVRRGVCVLLGSGDAALAAGIAAGSEFRILCVERDRAVADAMRDRLRSAGLYGSRATVHVSPDGSLPYAAGLANLVVLGRHFDGTAAAALVQPDGGALVAADVGMLAGLDGVLTTGGPPTWIRGALPGAGSWTHMFADAGNTSCSGDTLVRGSSYRVQWFGDPTPPRNVGWHGNGMGPLFRDSRIYHITMDQVEAIDAWNGTSLWLAEVPGSARLSPGREGGSACVAGDRLYLAVDRACAVLDTVSGRNLGSWPVAGGDGGDWGWIAVADRWLLGSRQAAGATYRRFAPKGGKPDGFKGMWESSEPQAAVSTLVFAKDRTDGSDAWSYGDGRRAIVNSSIAIGGGRLFLVESRVPAHAADEDGSVLLREIESGGQAFLVALDLATGKPVWERPLGFATRSMLYLSWADGKLVLSGSLHVGPLADEVVGTAAANLMAGDDPARPAGERKQQVADTRIRFLFRQLDAADGRTEWDAAYTSTATIGAQHNYNVNHPVITRDVVWHIPAEQHAVRIARADGSITELPKLRRSKGCATPTGSAGAAFFRSMTIAGLDFASERMFLLSSVNRPSCWMSVLPAGGLVLMPEGSIGCNCAFPMQTSIVMAPMAP